MAYSKQNFQNGQILNAANLEAMENGIIAGQGAYNLLDNSDFSNPVNQRGQSSYTGQVYGIDRWYGRAAAQTVSVRSTDVTVTATGTSYPGIKQKIKGLSKLAGKTVTFAAKIYANVAPELVFYNASDQSLAVKIGTANATQTIVMTYTIPSDATTDSVIPTIMLRTSASGDYMRIYWAALYEGSYTASTLPAYQPKGYAAELAECRRYYKKYSTCQFPITITSAAWAAVAIDYTDMRGTPTITYDLAGLYVADNVYTSITSITARALPASELVINTGVSVAANKTGTIRFNSLELSRDL